MTGEAIQVGEMKTGLRLLLLMALGALVLGTLVLVAALAFSGGTLRGFAVNSASTSAPTERVVIAVEGMYCDSCAAVINAMLKRTPGVVSAAVSYARKEAVVDYDSQKTTPEKIVEAINNLGYKASIKNKT